MSTFLEKLEEVTFSVHHSPNCTEPFQVRLVGKNSGVIDNLQNKRTKDIVGHGKTLEDAVRVAWTKKFGE